MSSAWNAITGQTQAPAAASQQWGQGQSFAGGPTVADTNQQHQQALGAQAASTMGGLGAQQTGHAQQQYGQLGAVQGQMGQTAQQMQANAAGQGQVQQAANAQLQQGVQQGLAAQMAAAGSAKGNAGLANAQRGAQTIGAGMETQAANQAAQMDAQAALQAQGQLGQFQLGQGQLAAGAAGQAAGQGIQATAGGLGLQQGYEQQGIGVQNAAAQTALGGAGIQEQQNAANSQAASALVGGVLGAAGTGGGAAAGTGGGAAAGGAALAAADVDMQEPGSRDNGFILREESGSDAHGPFILAASKQTGALGKVRIDPLTPSEHHQAMAPHGAGSLGSPGRQRTVMHEVALGAPQSRPTTLGPRGRVADLDLDEYRPDGGERPLGDVLGSGSGVVYATPKQAPALEGASADAMRSLHERLLKLEGRRGAGVR